ERGFRAMQYNFVVSTNVRAVRLWESLGVVSVGLLPEAFEHPTHGYVVALVMYRNLYLKLKSIVVLTAPFARIPIEPDKMNGQPCVRGLRITVKRVLEILAFYHTRKDLFADYPALED